MGDILLLTFCLLVTDVCTGYLIEGNSIKMFLYIIRDLAGNNNNGTANCIFYLTKKINQTEDGS
jgi:hypothetical protein